MRHDFSAWTQRERNRCHCARCKRKTPIRDLLHVAMRGWVSLGSARLCRECFDEIRRGRAQVFQQVPDRVRTTGSPEWRIPERAPRKSESIFLRALGTTRKYR